jgi:thiamine biosynthesis lipoprotein
MDAQAIATRDPAASVVTLDGTSMGTSWQVRLAASYGFDPAPLHHAIKARLARIVAEMSHWEPDSLLSRFNRARAGHWATLPPDFAQVMATGLQIAAASNGAFDPTMGRLADLWGIGPVPAIAPPDATGIQHALAHSGWQRLAFDPAARRLRQPGGLSLDLSGIAKGHAVDAVAALVTEAGTAHALIEIGGELVGRGVRPDGDPWWVDLEVPPGLDLPPLRIALHGIAVATSGDYRRGAHTLDPRTGRPTSHGVHSVSVIAETAMEADAWATAFTVLGPDAGLALATRRQLAARMIVFDNGGTIELISPALATMLAG